MDTPAGFLGAPPDSPGAQAMYDADLEGDGYVMNLTRVWAHVPDLQPMLFAMATAAAQAAGLTMRQKAVLVVAQAATRGDSYCSVAWGPRLAEEAGPEVARAVIAGSDDLPTEDLALARWARLVAGDANATTPDDVGELRRAGFDDRAIVGITAFVAARMAFGTVNDALGAEPDAELHAKAPAEVATAIDFGR